MIKVFKAVLILFLFFVSSFSSQAQIDYSYRSTQFEFQKNEESSLILGVESNNFFRNNEYFGSLAEGYTLVGQSFQPSLMYYASEHVRFQLGYRLLQFYGTSEFSESSPTFSLHAQINPNLDVIMGALNGHIHHQLPEAILSNEEQYNRPIETGLQLLVHSKSIQADVWMDWEQFIFHGDSIPEKFTAGVSGNIHLLNSSQSWKLNIPFGFLATHRGGQISNYEENMQTLANTSIGFGVTKESNHPFFQETSFNFLFLGYEDVNKARGYDFYSGSAIYPTITSTTSLGQIMIGYWKGDNYMSAKGNPLFNSISSIDNKSHFRDRRMITTKIVYCKEINKGVKFSVNFEGLYDLNLSQFEYTYGVNLTFSPQFFITKVRYKY
ncbi:hypothetical protein OAA06_00405 [bacterium]|nr:hypothetical protein [bacterium]